MPPLRRKSGNRGNRGRNAWEPHNLLKLKAGHRGNRGNRKKTISINVLQTPNENRSSEREIPRFPRCPRCPRCPNHSFIIYYIIKLYIYIYGVILVGCCFRSFGNRGSSFGNRKSITGNRKTSRFPLSETHFPSFSPLNFHRIGGKYGLV